VFHCTGVSLLFLRQRIVPSASLFRRIYSTGFTGSTGLVRVGFPDGSRHNPSACGAGKVICSAAQRLAFSGYLPGSRKESCQSCQSCRTCFSFSLGAFKKKFIKQDLQDFVFQLSPEGRAEESSACGAKFVASTDLVEPSPRTEPDTLQRSGAVGN
jgi:hypothetical protein